MKGNDPASEVDMRKRPEEKDMIWESVCKGGEGEIVCMIACLVFLSLSFVD